MLIGFEGRRVVVTGAGQGIGRAIVEGFADAGAWVAGFDLDQDGLARCARADQLVALDVSDREAVHQAFGSIAAAGGIDVLVNCAGGVCGQTGRPLAEIEPEGWASILAANVETALWCAQAAAPSMQAKGAGRIVNIASGAGLRPSLTGIAAYTVAKHGLVGLTRQLAQDLGPLGITVNAVAPGFVRSNPSTEQQWERYGPEGQARLMGSVHMRRPGTAADIAHAVLFLASDQAGWISGQVLSVDGGRA